MRQAKSEKRDEFSMRGEGPHAQEDSGETSATILASIGMRIREARQARGMTLQALADMSGLSPSMLSLVERGRASPSIGSLIVIASALEISMADIIVGDAPSAENPVVRSGEQRIVETTRHVVRRLIREDRTRGVSMALDEYGPSSGQVDRSPAHHDGFEYGYVLEGQLTVEIDGVAHHLQAGDTICYSGRRRHKITNHGRQKVRTLWFKVDRD